MSRKKVSTTIYITPEQADRLKLLHERTKVPIAVYIREGIDLVLKHYEHVLPGQMSLDAQHTPRPPLASHPPNPETPKPPAQPAVAKPAPPPEAVPPPRPSRSGGGESGGGPASPAS
jgi:hypothetical protein